MRREIHFTSGIKLFCLLAAGLFLLSACGKAGQKHTSDPADAHAESNAVFSDFEYQCIAESVNGYYFWERISTEQYYPRLMFMDKESGVIMPLCNKPNCMHEGKECSAYYPKVGAGEDGIDKNYLQYYRGDLYAVGLSADNYAALFRIKEDGTEWEISSKLFRTDYTGHWKQPEILIDGGYVYFVDWYQKIKKLERMPIGGGTSEIVFEGNSDASAVNISRMESNGNDGFLYFQVIDYFNDVSENREGGLYRCDTSTGQCSMVKEGLLGPYSVQGGFVYYGNTEGLCRYSIQDQTTEILVNRPMNVPNITLTRDYIILCDQMVDNRLIIYDYSGKEIATVSNTLGLGWYFGGNSDMLFGECWNDNLSLCFLDLNRPVGELQWEELKEN